LTSQKIPENGQNSPRVWVRAGGHRPTLASGPPIRPQLPIENGAGGRADAVPNENGLHFYFYFYFCATRSCSTKVRRWSQSASRRRYARNSFCHFSIPGQWRSQENSARQDERGSTINIISIQRKKERTKKLLIMPNIAEGALLLEAQLLIQDLLKQTFK